jgi:hypothetical protein
LLKKFWRRWGTATLILLAVLSLVATGVYAQVSYHSDVELHLPLALPEAAEFELLRFESVENGYLYAGDDANGNQLGYVTITEAQGYGGTMTVVVGWSLEATILAVDAPEHYEDMQPWFQRLYDQGFFDQYIGRQYSEPLELDNDIDAVTRSTISVVAVAMGVQRGRALVAEQLGLPYPPIPKEPVSFGLVEILLLTGLGSVVALRLAPGLKKLRWARYLTLLFGLVVLGFWFVIPLSLVNFAIWMVGFAPTWQSHLFLYILVFGVVGLAVVLAKNVYCFWLCPFSAMQEVMHFLGGGRVTPTSKWHRRLRNVPYFLLWLALILALLSRNPSMASFEPWQSLFSLSGTADQWLLVIVTLVAAMIVKDFWCHYLCPIRAVLDIILKIRRRLKAKWFQKVNPRLKRTAYET